MTTTYFNLGDALRANLDNANDRAQAMFQTEANAIELRDRFARMEIRHDIKPGDFVQPKLGFEIVTDSRRHVVLMFIRMLDLENSEADRRYSDCVHNHLAVAPCNCLVMHVAGPEAVCIHAVPLDTLEPRHIDLTAFSGETNNANTP